MNVDETLELVRGRDSALAAESMVDVYGLSDPGKVRQRNEDQFLIAELGRTIRILSTSIEGAVESPPSLTLPTWLMVVADGIGGHGGGDVASSVATDSVTRYVYEMMPWFLRLGPTQEEDISAELKRALVRSQNRVERVAEQKGITNLDIGTTLTMAYVIWPHLYVVHAGDSRCYLARGQNLWQLTRDHTLAAQLAEARSVPVETVQSQFRHVLVNAIGGGTAGLTADVSHSALMPEDSIVLCTDGLTGVVHDPEILEEASAQHGARASCENLVRLANERGGPDNVTVVVARF